MASTYQIKLKGHLDKRRVEWLEGFSMTLKPGGETIHFWSGSRSVSLVWSAAQNSGYRGSIIIGN